MNRKFAGKVENGKIKVDDKKGLKEKTKKLEGKRIQLILRKYKTSRTIKQNSYYWGIVVRMLADEFGYTKQEMHEALKYKFLRRPGVIEQELPRIKSTRKLTTTQFKNYLENVKRWAIQEHQINIPDPDKVDWNE